MPVYVHAAAGAAGAALALPLLAPLPQWARLRAGLFCRILLVGGLAALTAGAALPVAGVWWPGMAALATAVTLWMVMFWFAREDPRRDDGPADDGPRGGGGGPPEPPRPRQPPGGGIDWDDFDRQRHAWEREPVLA